MEEQGRGVYQMSGRAMWQMFTHSHSCYTSVCVCVVLLVEQREEGRVFPQHVTFSTLHTSIFGRAYKNLRLWWWRWQLTAAAAGRPATTQRHTLRERENDRERGQRRSFHKYSVRPATPALYPFTESSFPAPPPCRGHKPHTAAPGQPCTQHYEIHIPPNDIQREASNAGRVHARCAHKNDATKDI